MLKPQDLGSVLNLATHQLCNLGQILTFLVPPFPCLLNEDEKAYFAGRGSMGVQYDDGWESPC